MFTVYAVSTVGWVLLAVAFLVIWIAIAFWPARVARRKGHSFIGYFIFSLFFFPLALLMAYLVHDRRQPAY
jgi:pilus assembly protein TadC